MASASTVAASSDGRRAVRPRGLQPGELRSFAGRSACNGGLTIGKVVVSFVASVAYSRALGADGRGQMAFVIGAASLLSLVAGAGLVPGVRVLRSTVAGDLHRAALAVVVVRGCGLAAVWLTLCWAGRRLGLVDVAGGLAAAVALLTPIIALPHAATATAAVDRREVGLSVAMVAGAALLVLGVGLSWVMGVVAPMTVMILWGVSIGGPALWSLRDAARVPTASGLVAQLHRISARSGLAELGLFATWRADTLLLGPLLGYRELGRYAVASSVAEALMALVHGIRLWVLGHGGGHGGGARVHRAVRWCLAAGLPVAAVMALVGPSAIPVLFGAEYAGLDVTLWFLLPGALALGLSFVLADQLAVLGATTASSAIALSALVLNLALNVLLVPSLGIEGAAIASAAAYLSSFVLLCWALGRAVRRGGANR